MPDPIELTDYAKKILEEKGYDWKAADKPTVVPPVEIPEYFPGFGQELTGLGAAQFQAQKRVIAAQQTLSNLQRSWGFTGPLRLPSPGESVYPITPFLGIVTQRDFEARRLAAQQEMDLALQEFKATEWKQEVMTTLPNYLSLPDYKVQSIDDVLQLIPLDTITDADSAWLTSTFERLKHLSNVLPEGFDGDAIEAQTKILDEILTAPKLELRAVHNLTVEEIAKSFAFGVAELPKGMTQEDVRYMLGQMELQDEEMQSAKEWLATRAKDWALETDRLNLIRAGTVLAEVPELTPTEFGKMLVTQPMMATVQMLDKYFNLLPRPLASAAVIGVHRLYKTPEDTAAARLEEQYAHFKSMGLDDWEAYATAFNEWDTPWYLKLGVEIMFDPVSYIGLGFATAAAYKLGYGMTKLGVRAAGTRIGPWVGAIENGYITGADAIFKTGVKAVLSPIKGAFWLTGAGYQIPRTFTQMARNFARDSYMKFSSVLQKTFPEVRNMKGLTVKDAVDAGTNAIDQAVARPMEGWDAAVRAGAPMMEFDYIDDVVARRMTKEIAEELTFDTSRLARFNNEVLNMFSGQGERITAGKIIADLGQEATEDMVNKMATKLVAFKEKVVKSSKEALKGDTATDVLMSMFNRLERIRYGNLNSPLTKYMQQAGRTASWHSRVADRILYSSAVVALERRMVMPIARWQLLFTNFGPYNFLENMQRSFLGGAEIMYPKAYSGVHETNRLFKGLANAPYELQMMERGEARLAQALVDPKTGRTAVFKGGKVPFVTKQVVIPEKIPFLGGKTVGKKINIAGRDHYLASFQDGYDMWAHFNSMQVAYDYQTHYMKELAKIAPDDMTSLVEILAKHKGKLSSVRAISARDAKDIERVLLQDATVSPAGIRAHADIDVLEFERRQISKDLGKTFDRATDVRSTTKKAIQDDVLDGSIFDDIDAKMSAYIEQERELSLISLKNQIDVLTDEADALLANPPRNLDEFMGDMQNITGMIEGTGERIHDYRKLTELRKARLLPGEMDDFEVGSAKLLAEFMETSEEQLTKIMNQMVKNAKAIGKDVDWDRVIFTNMSESAERSIRGVVDDIPIELRARVTGYDIEPDLRVAAAYDDTRQVIQFGSEKYITPKNIYHELAHSHTHYLYDSEPRRALDILTELADILRRNRVIQFSDAEIGAFRELIGFYQSYSKYPRFHEYFSEYFEEWLTKGAVGGPAGRELGEFFSKNFPKRIPKMNEVQLARLTDLDSISRLELENILATRNKVAQIESIIPRTPKKSRNDRFWSQQRNQKSTIWDEFDTNARKFKSMRLRSSRNFLQSVDKSVYVPDFVPEVVDFLTPNHLAYLYGATGDDLYRGLTRIQHHATIRPREDFILHTVEQADAYAATLGKNAADIGFTDEAIGEVYDQLWRNLGVEPSILTPDSPTVMQMEEIRQEITRLYGALKLPGAMDWGKITWGEGMTTELRSSIRSTIDEMPFDFKSSITKVEIGDATIKGVKFGAVFHEDTGLLTFRDVSMVRNKGLVYHELAHSLAWTDDTLVSEFAKLRRMPEVVRKLPVVSKEEEFAEAFSMWVENPKLVSSEAAKFFDSKFPKGDAPDIVNYRQYINSVADDVEKLPMYKAAEVVPTPEFGLEAFKDLTTDASAWVTESLGGKIHTAYTAYQIAGARKDFFAIARAMASSKEFTTTLRTALRDIGMPENFTVYRGAAKGAPLAEEFVNTSVSRKVAVDIREFIGSTTPASQWEVRAFNVSVDDVVGVGRMPEGELFFRPGSLKEVSDIPTPLAATNRWQASKESAMTKTREQHALSYPTYDDANIIDEGMRALFPFWNYEMFRWRWLPRTALRTPGAMTGVAKYVSNTDQGYLPVPGTDLQMNILRGSVWMGGLRSFYLRDFPEYYDVMPGMEFIDYIGRAGFFPGIHVMLPIVLFGAATGKPEFGQLAPAWMRTGLSGLRTLSPEHIGKVLEHIYPDRFRDYMTMLTLGEEGYDADEIWRKKQTGEKLTPEEDELWLRATARVDGVKGILMQQTGLFRIRPQEFTDIRKEMRLAVEEATGVPISVQEQIDRNYPVTGKRFSDYYKLDVYQQKLLYEWETYRRWQGVTTPLYPSSWQLLDVKIRDYYEAVEKIYEDARTVGIYEDGELVRPSIIEANRQWVEGEIGPDQWKALRSDIQGGLADAVRILGESPAYKDVPKTFEERATMLEERGIPTPTQTPDQELLYYYYELRPEYRWNWESQRMERDFDTYYAYIDILLESLDAPHRERLLERIQSDWTPLEQLYWNVSREYMRPYRNLRDIVLKQYSPEEIQQIRRYEVASAAEREAIQEIIGPDGDKLISGYQRTLREARQRLRILDPNTDAWLNFFGVTTSLLSTEAEETYEKLREKFLTKEMIK